MQQLFSYLVLGYELLNTAAIDTANHTADIDSANIDSVYHDTRYNIIIISLNNNILILRVIMLVISWINLLIQLIMH